MVGVHHFSAREFLKNAVLQVKTYCMPSNFM